MSVETTSMIAQLLFTEHPELNFAHVVGELDAALAKCPATVRSLTWDCDDVAVFDLDGSRVVLAFSDDLTGAYAACLTVSVGHGPARNLSTALASRRNALSRMITDRLSGRYDIDEILWHEATMPVTAEVIDELIEKLPRVGGQVRTEDTDDTPDAEVSPFGEIAEVAEVERLMARMEDELETRSTTPRIVPVHPATAEIASLARPSQPRPAPLSAGAVANDRPHLPASRDNELSRVRAALYPPEPAPVEVEDTRPSTPLRLACHAMNATLIVVALPVGAAVMTYSVLRGEDMKFSARVMMLTGTLLTIGQLPMGQHLMSMI
jgi:hypothetical protein